MVIGGDCVIVISGFGGKTTCLLIAPNKYPLAPAMMAVITIAIAVRRQLDELSAVTRLVWSGIESSSCIKSKTIITSIAGRPIN